MLIRNDELTNELKIIMDTKPFHEEKAMVLIDQGADPHIRNSKDHTILHLFARYIPGGGTNDDAIAKLVKIYGVDINAVYKHYEPLDYLLTENNNPNDWLRKSAMNMVRLGAHPDAADYSNNNKNSLLHSLVHVNKDNINDDVIEELIIKYHADVNIEDIYDKTPLQKFLKSRYFNIESAIKLVHLGANPETLLKFLIKRNTDSHYDNVITELKDIIKFRTPSKSNFLSVLFFLSRDFNSPSSTSFFKTLPLEVMLVIINSLDLEKLGKTKEECCDLAKNILEQDNTIKTLLGLPGGINVKQYRDKKDNQYHFTLFKPGQPANNEKTINNCEQVRLMN